jgi:nicotinamide mononucleotide transporter
MYHLITEWLTVHYIEVLGAILGLCYILFSIRQSILTWPTGLATSVLYIFVFFRAKFYADMALQFYYVFISIYGWYLWNKGNPSEKNNSLPIKQLNFKMIINSVAVSSVLFIVIYFILKNHTDSPVPVMDALTTALSIVATYLLARKFIEHWLIWIFVDLVSAGLYVYKSLWPTVILFVVYTLMAIAGFREWKKDLKVQSL